MQDLQAQSILSLFQTTKAQRTSFVNMIREAATDGNAKPLNILLQAKCMAEVAKAITDDPTLKDLYLSEGVKEGKKFTYLNAEFQQKEVGTKYDYSDCNNPVLSDLLAQQEVLTAKIKEQETLLKSIPTGQEIVHAETGCMMKAPIKTSTTQLTVSLK